MKPDEFPVDGCGVARSILGHQLQGQEDFQFVRGRVRTLLRASGRPKTSDPLQVSAERSDTFRRLGAEMRRVHG